MTKEEAIALLTRIYETFSSRTDYYSISLEYTHAPPGFPDKGDWLIYIDGWSIDSEEDWQEYKIEHAVIS